METALTPLQQLVQYLPYLIPVLLIELVLLVIALVDLVRREKVRYLPKWGWALIIIFIQLFGSIAYLIIGREE